MEEIMLRTELVQVLDRLDRVAYLNNDEDNERENGSATAADLSPYPYEDGTRAELDQLQCYGFARSFVVDGFLRFAVTDEGRSILEQLDSRPDGCERAFHIDR